MKKQKFMKLTAFTSEPSLGDSFTAPATHDGEVSVVFRGKDISIHGYDGSVWSTIYTWNGTDKQFTFNNTYQNYFLKSLTGSQETVGVSFFSISRYQGSTPSLAGIDRDVKLHDIDEVPIYTASDVNKMLTIMSDGSLRWLLANESFIIPTEGESTDLEEEALLALYGNAQLVNGVLTLDGTNGTYASLPHSTDYDRESGDLTVHFWFNADSLPAADSNYTLMSKLTGANDWNGWTISYSTQEQDQGNSGPLMVDGGIGVYASNQGEGGFNAQPNNFRATSAGGVPANSWHHVAVTMPATGDYTIYLNGQSIGSWTPPYRNGSEDTELLFGATKWSPVGSFAKFFPGELDQVTITKSILTASEIYNLHDTGRTSSGEEEEGENENQPGNIVGLEEDSNLTLHGNAQLIDGVLHFDGTAGTYASLPHSTDYDRQNGDLTISMWFKANSLPNNWNAGLVSKMGNGWQGYITAVTTMSGLSEGGLQTSTWTHSHNSPNSRASLSEGIALGEWHHAAYVMVQTGQYKMYFNGQEVKSYNPAHRNTSTTGPLRIGGWQNGIYHGYFDGQIEGVKIEKSARSAAAILEEYNSGAPSAATPSAAAGIESLGTNTLSGDAQQTAEGLLITNDGYADTQSNYHNGATEQTISAWFKASELGTVSGNNDPTWRNNGHVIALTRNWAAGGYRANGFVISVASNAVRFGGPHGTNNVVMADYDFSVDTWYKIDLVWTSNSMKLYVNGVEISSTASSGTIAGGSVNMRIGRNINQFMNFKGNILGVEVENVAKTGPEILASYQSQA